MRAIGFAWGLLAAVAAVRTAAAGEEGSALVLPDAEGVLDLAAVQRAEAADALPNPFRIRYRPAPALREVTLVIRSLVMPTRGEDASVLVNGRLYSPGDSLEGLKLARIAADSLELRADGAILRVPVRDRPSKLRLLP